MQVSKRLFAALTLTALAGAVQAADEVVVYSARIDELIKPVFDAYTAKTGVAVKFITDKEAPLLARLQAEGANTPADMLITVDAGNLWQAEQEGVLKPLKSAVIDANIPCAVPLQHRQLDGPVAACADHLLLHRAGSAERAVDLRSPGRQKLGRPPVPAYQQEGLQPVADRHPDRNPRRGQDRRTSSRAGSITWPPTCFADDTALLQAIDAGQCDVGITNTYYYGRLHQQQPDLKVKPYWPNQNDRGVHVNLAGAGVTKHAPHADAAQKLLEWMTTEEAQATVRRSQPGVPGQPEGAGFQGSAGVGQLQGRCDPG